MRHLIREVAGRVGVRGIAIVMQAICMILIARQQGPAVFGLYAVGMAVGAVSGTVLGMGSSSRALRILREHEPVVVSSSLVLIRLIGSVVSLLFVIVVLVALGAPWPIALSTGIIAVADQICEVEQATRAGFREQASSAYVIFMQRLLPFIAVCSGWFFQNNVIIMYALADVFVIALVLIKPLRRFNGQMDLLLTLRTSLGYWAASLSQALQQLDVPIVRLVVGEVGVGYYGAANRIVGPLGVIANSLVVVVAPRLGGIQDARRRAEAFVRLAAWVAVFGAMLAICSPFVAEIVIFLLGPEYSAARPLLIGITVAAGISMPSQVFQSYLYFEKRPGSVARVGYFSVISGLVALTVSGLALGTAWVWLGPFVMYVTMTGLLTYVVLRQRGAH